MQVLPASQRQLADRSNPLFEQDMEVGSSRPDAGVVPFRPISGSRAILPAHARLPGALRYEDHSACQEAPTGCLYPEPLPGISTGDAHGQPPPAAALHRAGRHLRPRIGRCLRRNAEPAQSAPSSPPHCVHSDEPQTPTPHPAASRRGVTHPGTTGSKRPRFRGAAARHRTPDSPIVACGDTARTDRRQPVVPAARQQRRGREDASVTAGAGGAPAQQRLGDTRDPTESA